MHRRSAARPGVVVAGLDASLASRAVLAVAADLAGHLHARLAARFVEEDDWLAAAALPCARWVAASTGTGQALTAEQVELTWRAAATRMRAALDARSAERSVQWSFEVVRGRAWAVLGEAGRAAEVLVLGTHGWQGDGQRLGSVARAALGECAVALALVPAGARRPARWAALLDTPAGAPAVLAMASALAAGGASVEAWCTPELADAARAALAGRSGAPPLHGLAAPWRPGRLPAELTRSPPAGVVLARASRSAAPAHVPDLLAGAAALLLVGEPPQEPRVAGTLRHRPRARIRPSAA